MGHSGRFTNLPALIYLSKPNIPIEIFFSHTNKPNTFSPNLPNSYHSNHTHKMEKLLKWSLSAGTNADGKPIEAPDSKLIAELFGGKDDVQSMRDNMTVILHPEAEKEDKLVAFDNFEMLIENLDNANNIQPLGLWQPLIGQLDQPDLDYQRLACWIIGTAVQNNPPAQKHLLETRPLEAIPKLLELVKKSKTEDEVTGAESGVDDIKEKRREVRLKAIYALTSELGHNEDAYAAFVAADGWATISSLFGDSSFTTEVEIDDVKVRTRALSLLRVLLTIEPLQEATHAKLREDTFLVQTLLGPIHLSTSALGTNMDLRDRTLALISILQEAEFKFTDAEKKQAKVLIEELRVAGEIEKDEYQLF